MHRQCSYSLCFIIIWTTENESGLQISNQVSSQVIRHNFFHAYFLNSRIDRENLVLRHSVPHLIFEELRVERRDSTAASPCQSEEIKIVIINIIFFQMEIAPTTVAFIGTRLCHCVKTAFRHINAKIENRGYSRNFSIYPAKILKLYFSLQIRIPVSESTLT